MTSVLSQHAARHAEPTAVRTSGYAPFALATDARRFGLTTSAMRLGPGSASVWVRHGRRTDNDTATILLHGAAGSWTTWTPLLQAASEDSRRLGTSELRDLIIPDLPGWGDTPLPADTSDLTIETMAATIADIARALGYRRWNVVGHSMGGLIALQLAAAETRATVSVGLVSATTFSVIDSVRHPVALFRLLPGYTALLQVMRLLHLAGTPGRALVTGLDRLHLLRGVVSPLFRHAGRIHPSVIAAFAREVRPHGFSLASARAGEYDAVASWSRIVCPVRASVGDRDVFVAASDAHRLRAIITNFSIVTLANAGHFGHLERPCEVVRALGLAGDRQTHKNT
ncbi:alpha/beta fold hydrolase [Cryobacterium sp. CG_9.6]|uniref:alpha/beta fold hydrolase n=1 Tax=Cryobacterium sp. CG_9.6 TaxID=2760710 RepID=UPI0024769B2B|nr:alpha/beta fold hydrolase [Cryobacterium sp. CG_9.6]MDH6236198.1 pimeloyl-ACP methyl ester carboxylesterase [Cryobacterium sp. CG_9.6]